jgi:hypothetical protein
MSDYRVVAYCYNGSTLTSGPQTLDDCDTLIDQLITAGIITGAHIDQHIRGIGWRGLE